MSKNKKPVEGKEVTVIKVGDIVRKPMGYVFIGVVRSVYETESGEKRFDVENTEGLLHIMNEKQLDRLGMTHKDFTKLKMELQITREMFMKGLQNG